MHIGFDAKRFFYNATGLGNYSRNTIFSLAETFPEHRYFLYAVQKRAKICTNPHHPAIAVQEPCPLGRALPALWRTWGLPRTARPHALDIFHGLSHELPAARFSATTRTVVTMHDLLFVTHPHLYPWIDRQIYAIKYRASCLRADVIVAISTHTAQNLCEWLRIPEERVQVVYQCCDPGFFFPPDQAAWHRVRERYHLPAEYVLFVGSLIPRKGCMTLLQAVAALPAHSRIPVVVVGTGPQKQDLERLRARLGLSTLVHFLGRVDSADLPALYQQATVFSYPSVGEGFGIPILEALCSKVPVITSTGSCFAEVGGDAALYTEPGKSEALAHALAQVLGDSALRQTMITRGLRQAQQFHPQATATRLMRLYTDLHTGHNHAPK